MMVKFIRSVYDLRDLPPADKPEVVFVGRSNVGKSSLINMVAGRKVARTSKDPGRTRCINYYLIDDRVYLVDLPGYGFARVPKDMINRWKRVIEGFFRKRSSNIKRAFVLIDGVVGPTQRDREMVNYLRALGISYSIVITKVDKATQKDLSGAIKKLKEELIQTGPIISSAKEGLGRKEILSQIF